MLVPIPEPEVMKAWLEKAFPNNLSTAVCECRCGDHGHEGRCNIHVLWEHRNRSTAYGWRAYRISESGPAVAMNCGIIYHDCYRKMRDENLNYVTTEM